MPDFVALLLPAWLSSSLSLANALLALVVLVVIAVRLGRFDRARIPMAPIQWLWCFTGHAVLGMGMLLRIAAEHGDTLDLRRLAAFLTLLGIVMVFTRSRRNKAWV